MTTDMRAIVFNQSNLLLEKIGEDDYCFPQAEGLDVPEGAFIVGDCAAFEGTLPEVVAVGLRESWKYLSDNDYALAGKAAELLHWDRNVRYCSKCGSSLRRHTEISKVCGNCGCEYFPQLSAAIVVLVKHGEKALLVRAKNFSRPFYALVAGFVETGETLEECVAREVREETSLIVDSIKYEGSQSWPFPSQLMLGFTARYAGGDLCFADGELVDGGFYSRESLPLLPSLPSLSRKIIDKWIEEGKNAESETQLNKKV